VESESWFYASKPKLFDTNLSGDNCSCEFCDILFLEEDFREFIVELLVSISLRPLPQHSL